MVDCLPGGPTPDLDQLGPAMTFDISTELLKRNTRFRQQGIPLSLELRSNRLMIRGTLPPKPGSPQKEPYRQRMDTGFMPTRLGIQEAEKRLRAVQSSLQDETFSWEKFAVVNSLPRNHKDLLTIEKAMMTAEFEYFKTRDKTNRKKQHTWYSCYLCFYKQMNPGAILTNDLLREFVLSKPAGRSIRTKSILACRFLARANKIHFEYDDLKTNWHPSNLKFRNPPSDEKILERYKILKSRCRNIPHPTPANVNYWNTILWVYGMMATFGLRTHETNFVQWNDDNSINILQHKTDEYYGPRMNIYPFPPDWVDLFKLREGTILVKIRPYQWEPSGMLSTQISVGFKKANIGFLPYDLRHAYALRLMRLKVDHSIASIMMGHTVAVHMMIYRRWISESLKQSEIQKAYQYLEESKRHG